MIYFKPIFRTEHASHVCNVCGKPSEQTICDACCVRIRAQALILKKHKDKGEV